MAKVDMEVDAKYSDDQKHNSATSFQSYKLAGGKDVYKIPTSKTLLSRLFLELLVVTILGYPMLHIYVFLKGNLEPYGRGFFCDDQNLKHPYIEEEISITECVVIWFGIVLVILPSIEVLHFATFEYKEWETQMQDRSNTGLLGCFSKLPVIVIELYRILGYFFIGALGCLLTTELAKYKIGRLRPYYLTVCNLKLTDELCKDEFGYNKFVEPPHSCVPREGDPDPKHTINEAKKSFMSGHSSFSFYCATFLVIYLHARLSKTILSHSITKKKTTPQSLKVLFRILRILRPFLQFLIYTLAIYIALTRISDYRHHPTDVITGIIVGNLFAFLILFLTVDLFRRPRSFFHTRYTILNNTSDRENLLPVVAEGAYDVDGRKEKPKETCDTKVILIQDESKPNRKSNVERRFGAANQRVEALLSN